MTNTGMTTAPMPLSSRALDELADAIAAGTTVAGLGESTRFAHETLRRARPALASAGTGAWLPGAGVARRRLCRLCAGGCPARQDGDGAARTQPAPAEAAKYVSFTIRRHPA
jgi:hypothetical protein